LIINSKLAYDEDVGGRIFGVTVRILIMVVVIKEPLVAVVVTLV
jgi:hypothetical protein